MHDCVRSRLRKGLHIVSSLRLSVACLFRLISHVPPWYLVARVPQDVPLWALFGVELRERDESLAAAARNLVLLPDEHWPLERLAAHSEQHAAAPSVQMTDGLLFSVAAEDEIPPWVRAWRVVLSAAEAAVGLRGPDAPLVAAAQAPALLPGER